MQTLRARPLRDEKGARRAEKTGGRRVGALPHRFPRREAKTGEEEEVRRAEAGGDGGDDAARLGADPITTRVTPPTSSGRIPVSCSARSRAGGNARPPIGAARGRTTRAARAGGACVAHIFTVCFWSASPRPLMRSPRSLTSSMARRVTSRPARRPCSKSSMAVDGPERTRGRSHRPVAACGPRRRHGSVATAAQTGGSGASSSRTPPGWATSSVGSTAAGRGPPA